VLAYSNRSKNFHGLVQRLVLKEKQVLQLQAEVDRFKADNPNEGRAAVSLSALPALPDSVNIMIRMTALGEIVKESRGTF
jgi:hypothetical protein